MAGTINSDASIRISILETSGLAATSPLFFAQNCRAALNRAVSRWRRWPQESGDVGACRESKWLWAGREGYQDIASLPAVKSVAGIHKEHPSGDCWSTGVERTTVCFYTIASCERFDRVVVP
jgi:hypothetical protein